MCKMQIGQPHRPKRVKVVHSLLQTIRCIQIAALVLLLLRRKRTIVRNDAIPRTTKNHKLFKKNVDSPIKTHHNQHSQRRGDRKISNGKGVVGSLTFATIEVNFDQTFELKMTRLFSCDVQSASIFRRHARWIVGKTTEFPVLK